MSTNDSYTEISEKISSLSLFKDIPASAFRPLIQKCRLHTFPSKYVLFEDQFSVYDVMILIEGRIIAKKGNSVSSTAIVDYSPGDILGLLPALSDEPYYETAVTTSKCVVAAVPAQEFARLTKEHPEISKMAYKILTLYVKSLYREIFRDRIPDALSRLASLFLDLSYLYRKNDGTKFVILPPISREEMAERIGSSHMTVVRSIAELEKYGYISRHVRNVIVKDIDALEAFLERRLD